MNKKVANIVFYKFNSGNEDKVNACIFYTDGTVKNVSKKEAVKEAIKIAKEENAVGDFSSLLNKKRIFAMSGSELTKRFSEFVSYDIVETSIDKALDNIELTDLDKVKKGEDPLETTIIPIEYNLINNKLKEVDNEKDDEIIYNKATIVKNDLYNNKSDLNKKMVGSFPTNMAAIEEEEKAEDLLVEDKKEDLLQEEKEEDLLPSDLEEDLEKDNLIAMFDEKPSEAPKLVEEEERKTGIFTRIKNFVKGKMLPIAVAASLVGGTGVGYALAKDFKPNAANLSGVTAEQEAAANGNDDEVVVNYADNDYYNGYTYQELLDATTNKKQKEVMQNVSEALDWFNGEFADAYVEEGKDIRAALSWDEMVALQIAYNDYDKQELHAIFNGAEISSNDLENAYKNATLQLMGAYVIEQEPNLVDVTKFVHNKEGIEFVQKYQNMLEAAKNATGDEKLRLIEAFYTELYKDFPITEEVRTEGISHSDHRTIESYKLAVAPMVAAAEIMFQNYEIDHTLTDEAIDYFNDLGLCNLAQDKFDKVEMITLACCEYDEENPLYEQFKNAKIIELKNKNIYVIDDEHRDLSQLDRFQELVNWHFQMVDGHFELETWYTTKTYTTKKTWTEKHTKKWTETTKTTTDDRDEAVRKAGEDKVREAEEKVDQEIEEENKRIKEEAEQEAEEKKDELQEAADQHKQDLEEEVKKDDQDLQSDIEDANDKIDHGQTVNEDDFDNHNVDFDDEHSDDNGNLDDSIRDITTDGTGADEKLPDPNETGKAFDDDGDSYEPEIIYDVEEDEEIDRTETPETTNTNNNENNSNNNNSSNDSNNDLPDPSDFDNNSNNNSNENDYDVEYDDEIDRSEDTKSESKKEEKKQEAAPKVEAKKEEPKQEAPKAEPKKEEPKQEAAPAKKSNEQAVNDYVEKQASEPQEEEKEKTLVKE